MKNVVRSLIDFWVDHPTVDYAFAVCVTTVVLLIDVDMGIADHGAFYQALVSVALGLLFVASVVITLLYTVTPTDRLQRVQARVGFELQRLIASSIGGLLLATVGFVALFSLDESDRWVRTAVALMAGALCALRAGRLWWLLRHLLAVAAIDRSNAEIHQDSAERWVKPAVTESDYSVTKVSRPRASRHRS